MDYIDKSLLQQQRRDLYQHSEKLRLQPSPPLRASTPPAFIETLYIVQHAGHPSCSGEMMKNNMYTGSNSLTQPQVAAQVYMGLFTVDCWKGLHVAGASPTGSLDFLDIQHRRLPSTTDIPGTLVAAAYFFSPSRASSSTSRPGGLETEGGDATRQRKILAESRNGITNQMK